LVAKNGILIVEFANRLQEEGVARFEAAIQAATTRLRPILMTTVATVVGHFPLVIATGAGAGARNSIGIMLVSGMILGTVFTLFAVPVFYTLIGGRTKRAVAGNVVAAPREHRDVTVGLTRVAQ
jgi:multidrug efflux pump